MYRHHFPGGFRSQPMHFVTYANDMNSISMTVTTWFKSIVLIFFLIMVNFNSPSICATELFKKQWNTSHFYIHIMGIVDISMLMSLIGLHVLVYREKMHNTLDLKIIFKNIFFLTIILSNLQRGVFSQLSENILC